MALLETIHAIVSKDGRTPNYLADALLSFLIASFWTFWSLWLIYLPKSAGAIFGLVAVCMLLLYLTIRCWRHIIIGTCTTLSLFTLSPLFVVGGRPFLQSLAESGCCRLCCRCEAIVQKSPLLGGSPWIPTLPTEKYEFYNKSELIESKFGCHICYLLFSSIDHFKTPNINVVSSNNKTRPDEGDHSEGYPNSMDNERNILKIWMRRSLFRSPVLRIQISGSSIVTSKPLKLDWQLKEQTAHQCNDSLYTNSKDVFGWANERIEKCSKHRDCQNEFVHLSQKKYLPLRLLDVQEASNGVLRLLSSAQWETNAHAPYCALSHCWGGTVEMRLTSSNLEAMRSIQVEALPRTFQDAVLITGQLGARYLWIDSLCIVQDDLEDWEVQSTYMGLVYANAKCVISATASKDSTGGCFQSRSLKYNDCLLHKCGNKVLTIRKLDDRPQLSDLFKLLVDDAPVTKRAWTFQERYLATRTLHFCEGLVLFECNSVIASAYDNSEQPHPIKPYVKADGKLHTLSDLEQVEEEEEKWSPPEPEYSLLSKHRRIEQATWKRRRKIRPEWAAQQERKASMLVGSARLGTRGAFEFLWRFKGESVTEKIEFNNSWFELVQQYSARQLTFGSDKAIAIAGMASFVQKNTGLIYAAGLWSEMLPFNLLWITSNNLEPRPIRSVPSWSWISVDGEIAHPLNIREKKHRIVYASKNTLSENVSFRSNWRAVKPLISSESLLEEQVVNGLIHNAILQLSGQLRKLDASKMSISFDTNDHSSVEELCCLPILSFCNANLPPNTTAIHVHGIVLLKKIDFEARYERVGYFWTVDESLTVEILALQGLVSTIEIV